MCSDSRGFETAVESDALSEKEIAMNTFVSLVLLATLAGLSSAENFSNTQASLTEVQCYGVTVFTNNDSTHTATTSSDVCWTFSIATALYLIGLYGAAPYLESECWIRTEYLVAFIHLHSV